MRLPNDNAHHRLADRQLWIGNVALLALIASGYLLHAPVRSTAMAGYLFLGIVSCATTISLAPGFAVALARWLGLPVRARGILAAGLWALTALALFLDVQVYGIFRYHFDGVVWNVMVTAGSNEAVHILPLELWIVGLGAGLLFIGELMVYRWLCRRHVSRVVAEVERSRLLDPPRVWSAVLAPVMVLQVCLLARAEILNDREVMSISRVYPVLPRLHIGAWSDPLIQGELAAIFPEGSLRYPSRPLALPADGPTPNIVILVVDSLRADMLTPELMPRTSSFAERGLVFRNHLSGGNATRFGVFSLIYGLHGCYWDRVYREHTSPVLIELLLQRGYETTILTSASMSYPEFLTTAWVNVQDTVEDRLRGERPGGRDDGVLARFVSWLYERGDHARPFLAFLLLDAPHQGYSFPAEFGRFRPYAESVSYLKVAFGPTAEDLIEIRNRYLNAVLYADDTIGNVLDALSASGELEHSIVIVTGDHGEEFMDNGFFGHASNFTRAQLQVPLVWFDGAGAATGTVTAPTSHVDVPVTLLERLGLDPALREAFSVGENLFQQQAGRVRVASGWDTLAIEIDQGRALQVSRKPQGLGGMEVHEADGEVSQRTDEILRDSEALLGRVASECGRF